jgi:itaconate CoA-transferase
LSNPFSELLVVSVEQAVAAPLCTSRLADMGARVIKVERAEGDFARTYDETANGDSSYFVWTNQGKESVVLDLKTVEDKKLLYKILKKADVFVQNLGPGVINKLGFASEKMRELNPKLITCDISGYGENGPVSSLKAYDLLVQAESGLIDISGGPNELGRIGVSLCDIGAGITAHAAIVEALFYRERTGQGYGVNISLFGVASDWMNVPLIQHKFGGKSPKRVGLMHPTIQPYAAFTVKEGSKIIIAIQNEREWARFCSQVLKLPDLSKDPLFETNNARVKNVEKLHQIINKRSGSLSAKEFTCLLTEADIAFGLINSVDALSKHAGLNLVNVKTTKGDDLTIAAPPINRTINSLKNSKPPPKLGEHTSKIFSEFGA